MADEATAETAEVVQILDRQALLKAMSGLALKEKDVTVPGLGTVRMREITGGEMDRYQASLVNKKGKPNPRFAQAKLIVLCAVDGNGQRVFVPEEAGAVAGWPSSVVTELFLAAAEVCGQTEADIEELSKNF